MRASTFASSAPIHRFWIAIRHQVFTRNVMTICWIACRSIGRRELDDARASVTCGVMPNAAPETRSRIITMIHKEGSQFLNLPRHGAPHAALLNRRALSAGPAAVLCAKELGISAICELLRDDWFRYLSPRLPQPASGVENPATSLTGSARRATPVFSNRRL